MVWSFWKSEWRLLKILKTEQRYDQPHLIEEPTVREEPVSSQSPRQEEPELDAGADLSPRLPGQQEAGRAPARSLPT